MAEKAGADRGIWRGAAAGLAATLVGIGLARFAFTPLIPALIAADWFSPPEAVYLGATNLAGYLAGALLARAFARRAPTPAVIRAALVAATLSFVACAWPAGFLWFFPWRLVSGISGGALMVLVTSSLLARTPPALRGRVSGVIFTGVGLGITIAGTVVPALARLDLTVTWLAFGGIAALLTLLTWRSWAGEPSHDGSAAADAKGRAATLGPIAVLIVVYVCDAVGFVPHSIFWIDYIARGLGLGLGVGGLYWIAFGVGAALGPLLAGVLADRVGLAPSLVLALVAKGLAVALPVALESALGLAVSSLVVGALTPGVPALISGRIVELLPPAEIRRAWAWLTIAFAVAQTVAAYGLSYLFARYGSYHLLFAIGGASLGLAAALALLNARRPRH